MYIIIIHPESTGAVPLFVLLNDSLENRVFHQTRYLNIFFSILRHNRNDNALVMDAFVPFPFLLQAGGPEITF